MSYTLKNSFLPRVSWRNKHHLYNGNLSFLFSDEQMLSFLKIGKMLYCKNILKGANHEHGFFNKKRPLVGMWYVIISIVQSYIHTMLFIYSVYIYIYWYTHILREIKRHKEKRGVYLFMLFAHPSKPSKNNHPTFCYGTFTPPKTNIAPKNGGFQ